MYDGISSASVVIRVAGISALNMFYKIQYKSLNDMTVDPHIFTISSNIKCISTIHRSSNKISITPTQDMLMNYSHEPTKNMPSAAQGSIHTCNVHAVSHSSQTILFLLLSPGAILKKEICKIKSKSSIMFIYVMFFPPSTNPFNMVFVSYSISGL